jgi:hypothetical protein
VVVSRYRKKPVVIEAWQFTGQHRPDWPMWLKAHPTAVFRCDDHGNTALIEVETLEGTMTANRGDWLIRGTQGEVYPCKPNIFADIYEPVE